MNNQRTMAGLGAMAPCGDKPTEPGHVFVKLNELASAISQLEKSIDHLSDRVQVISVPMAENPAGNVKEPPISGCEIERLIKTETDRVQFIERRIQTLMDGFRI